VCFSIFGIIIFFAIPLESLMFLEMESKVFRPSFALVKRLSARLIVSVVCVNSCFEQEKVKKNSKITGNIFFIFILNFGHRKLIKLYSFKNEKRLLKLSRVC